MVSKETICEAANVVITNGYALSKSLNEMIAGIENPQYRVAVVGQFQVGKSTLINKVFFGTEKLREGEGKPTTAVATDTEYGDTSSMEVYNWKDDRQVEEILVKTIQEPTKDDIDAVTVAEKQEDRTKLARTVSRVRITEPNEKLRGYTVVDTPGLDDTNQELLLNTTWRVIPSADLAILVVSSKSLGERERDLLRKGISDNGISRLMVLVSFNPRVNDQDEDGRAVLVNEIKAQLANMGRSDVEVLMYCYDPSIEDIINNVAELGLTLRTFLTNNALPGRIEKVAGRLKGEMENILVEVAAKLASLGSTDAEREAMLERANKEVARYKAKMEQVFENIKQSVVQLERSVSIEVSNIVDDACDAFVADMEKESTYADLKRFLDSSETVLRGKIMDRLAMSNMKVKTSINRIIDKYQLDILDAENDFGSFLNGEVKIEKPMVAKIPPLAIEIINVVILDYILPMGVITAIIARLCLPKGLNLVDWGARALVTTQVKSAIEKGKPALKDSLVSQISGSIENAFCDIKKALENRAGEQIDSLKSGLVAGASTASSVEARAKLESAKTDLQKAIATL